MKKKFLLLTLPALMVLSGCSSVSLKQKENIMLEDTVAHEEIFGEAEESPMIKIMNPRRAIEDLEKPHIGFQKMSYHDDVEDKDYYAVRFVAAVASDSVTATWTRGFSKANSDQTRHPLSAAGIVATKSYTTLNNNGEPASVPSDFGAQYNYLLVYSMYKIPTELANAYICAYLTVDDGVNTPVKSDVVAARVAGGNAFSFAANKSTGYFMQGRINGSNQIVDMNDDWEKTGNPDDNHAEKQLALEANDEFGYFYYEAGVKFQYFGCSNFNKETYYVEQSPTTDYIKVRAKGTYRLFVNSDNDLYVGCKASDITIYLKPSSNWFEADTTKFSVWYADEPTGSWANNAFLTEYDTGIYQLEHYNFIAHPKIIFVRHDKDASSPSWDNDWTQTGDINYTSASDPPGKTMCTISGWSETSWDFVPAHS